MAFDVALRWQILKKLHNIIFPTLLLPHSPTNLPIFRAPALAELAALAHAVVGSSMAPPACWWSSRLSPAHGGGLHDAVVGEVQWQPARDAAAACANSDSDPDTFSI